MAIDVSYGGETAAPSPLLRRSFRKAFPAAVRGRGVYVWDGSGRRYLDFSGSAAVNFIGHGVAEIPAAMKEQASNLEFIHSSQFTTPIAEEYAQELLAFAGDNFRGGAIFFTCGGSEAVETALKLARQYQVESGNANRHQVLSRSQSYHGATLGALSVSGNKRRREMFLPMVRQFAQVGLPYCYRCAYGCEDCAHQYASELERAIDHNQGNVAGFIFEPISGATLGAAVPCDDYLLQVADICKRKGVLLIADEVMTGMGRTGRNFAVDHWGVAPDILVTAKGLSSGYAPLGAVIASERVVRSIAYGSGAFLHGYTYSSHPISLAAGRAVLQRMEQDDLVAAADSNNPESAGGQLQQALRGLSGMDVVGDVRGKGLLWGVEFVAEKRTKFPFPAELNFAGRVGQAAARRGVLIYPMQGCVDGVSGDHILIAPPAVITGDEIAWATAQLRDAIDEAVSEVAQ